MKPVYNAKGGPILITPSANDLPYKNIVIYVPAEVTADLTDGFGVETDDVVLIAGYHAISPTKVRACTGSIYYCHNQDKPIDFV